MPMIGKTKKNIVLSITLPLIFNIITFAFATSLTPWSGKVVGVSDGDTITVMQDGRGVKIRLAEIDCPERSQPFGRAAKSFTSDLSFGKIVTVKPTTIDRYGRIVAHVLLPDGHVLNEDLVSAGLAWQYKKYSTSQKINNLEQEARTAKLGIWSEPNPIPPWEWRKYQRQGQQQTTRQSTGAADFHGNIRSRIFHQPDCRYYNCKNCTAAFKTREEAIQAGYRSCKRCKP